MGEVDAGSARGAPPENREVAPDALVEELTPAGAHFVRSHFALPAPVDTLALDGAVARPASVRLDELRRATSRTLPVTLECAGNRRTSMTPLPPGEPWRSGAVSTALWSGVPLAALLERAGLRDDVVELLTVGADSYARALPIAAALDPDVIVAVEMNGAPVPPSHGGPLRLVVPGWYGMASVKWLRALTALTRPFAGPFQTETYVYDDGPVTTMRVSSLIVAPRDDATLAHGRVPVWGWAWSGEAAIASVELSLDAGPWRRARLSRPVGPRAWTRWHALVDVEPGRHTLRARARDRAGRAQPEVPPANRLGYGNNLVPTIVFTCD
jgi:DMSO/TMAO reductase YedYZ molybdopterin-dependent catalytic subunit